MRFIYKIDNYKCENYLKIKSLQNTFTTEGIPQTLMPKLLPLGAIRSACPISLCADVAFDEDIGVTTVDGASVSAVRILVRLVPPTDDEEIAIPDDSMAGLRVTRKVRCALTSEVLDTYTISAAGPSRTVQWLIRAGDNTEFLITAVCLPGKAFQILAYLEMQQNVGNFVRMYHAMEASKPEGTVLTHTEETPLKRQKTVHSACPTPPAAELVWLGRKSAF